MFLGIKLVWVGLFAVFFRSLLPAECDRRFLELACRIDRYGMDFHKVLVSVGALWNVLLFTAGCVVQDISSIGLQMGVSGKGVTVFCGEHPNFTPLNNFPWLAECVSTLGGEGEAE